ncbi:DsbA family protein [Jidongwangia harbinensis]|uniref:DsbA family protein n=1 Tax=Jidongwangia harbinensis TaxID=2878561 RepID=UPI001CD9CD87|nr:thioredoxin domain-containing protein [Jidongwangia harbinensis]MCA2213164.1 DsbA family protein [Jidongwangia harbinensis]
MTSPRGSSMGKQGRERSRAVREAQAAVLARRSRRQRWVLAGGGLVIVALLAAIVVVVVNAAGSKSGDTVAGAVVRPANATAAGALTIGDPDAPVRLEVFLDYMCPFCGRFERANGAEIDRLVGAGTVRLEVYPLAFLDEASRGTEYSSRTANAAATVADRAPAQLPAFHRALFDRQPEEGTAGLTDDEIAGLARAAKVPDDVVAQFGERRFAAWVAASTKTALDDISGTPTVRIDGRQFTGDLYQAGPLTQAITAAATGPQ